MQTTLAMTLKRRREEDHESVEENQRRTTREWTTAENLLSDQWICPALKDFLYAVKTPDGMAALVKAALTKTEPILPMKGVGEIAMRLREIFGISGICVLAISYM